MKSALTSVMTEAVEQERETDAKAIAQEIIALVQAMEERGKPSLEQQRRIFPAYPPLTWTPRLNLAAGKAYLVAGDDRRAEERLSAALVSKTTAAEAALWLHALYTRTGDQAKLATLSPVPAEQALQSRLYATLLSLR